MSSKTFRKAINWLGILVIAHIAALIFFSIFLSGAVADMSTNDPNRANRTVLTFNIIFDVAFAFMYFKIKTSYVDYKRSFREILTSENYSFSKYFKEDILKEQLMMTVVFALFQIPFVIFFAIWGMSLLYPLLLEQIYSMDAGAYLVTNSALIGWLVNTLIFTFIFLLMQLFFFVKMKKDIRR